MSRKFADADSSFSDAEFVIFGVPLDETASHRSGAGLAPEKIREESWNFETYIFDLDVDLEDIAIHDAGDIGHRDIGNFVSKLTGQFPIFIGGEHSISPLIVSALKPDSVLVLDAHLDYRDEYEGNKNSHACAIRRISEIVGVEKVLAVGVRSMCKEEAVAAEKDGLAYITAEDAVMCGRDDLFNKLKLSGRVYVSLDMDALDPSFAPGVGTPEPYGMTPYMVREILRHLSGQIVGLDVVEVCPPYDNGNTASLAGKLIRDVIASVHKSRL